MSPNFPVPSKGALRVLRHLALGTSCTVAFAGGVLTEDVRRRIHIATQIRDNGRRIKASRMYHGEGTSYIAALEEAMNNGDYQPWDDSTNTPKKFRMKWTNPARDTQIGEPPKQPRAHHEINSTRSAPLTHQEINSTPNSLTRQEINSTPAAPRPHQKINSTPIGFAPAITRSYIRRQKHETRFLISQKPMPSQITKRNTDTERIDQPSVGVQERQERLANDLMKMLDELDNVDMVDAAIASVINEFADGLRPDELDNHLLEACVRLSQKCIEHNRAAQFAPVLIQILSIGPIDEESFYSLNTLGCIDRLITDSEINSAQSLPDLQKLADAAKLYTTKLCNKPCNLDPFMTKIGEKLCAATLKAKQYDLTHAVYWRMASTRGTGAVKCVDHLILANRGRRFHKEAIKDFHRFFKPTRPDQFQFFQVGNAVLDSAIDLGQLGEAEKFVFAATEMARNGGITTSTTWHLKLLGEHWRTNNDLSSTECLFNRIEPLLDYSSHPQALYAAIIQFCVEAGHESRARQYLERFEQSRGELKMDLRVQGHFALAKAMKHDWEGVKADFSVMDKTAADFASLQASLFTPILKIFAASHNVSETENFVRYFFDVLELQPNQYISNIMIGKYAQAREIDCIPTWIDYVRDLGIKVDPTSFNVILISLRDKWLIRFTDLLRISKEMQAVDECMVDADTTNILRNTAVMQGIKHSFEDTELARQLSALLPSEETKHDQTLHHAMRHALARGEPAEVLDLYYTATSQNEVSVKPRLVALAVRAAIRQSVNGDLSKAFELIKEAEYRGCDISLALTPLLLEQISEIDNFADDSDSIKAMVEATIFNLKQRDLQLPVAVATTVATKLINRHESGTAIQLLTAVLASNQISRKRIDIVTLTVLLRAYIDQSDCNGIHWVMNLMSENNITADKHFKLVLKNGRREARRAFEKWPEHEEARRRYEILEQSFQVAMAGRAQTFSSQKNAVAAALRIMESASTLHVRQTTVKGNSREHLADDSHEALSKSISMKGKVSQGHLETLPLRWCESEEGNYEPKDMSIPLLGAAAA